ncbi:MAG: methyl-accepting chemotaxis protein, partial [Treponema berlinense]|nr:methyl-accepting chemotaxis protein [Treponema berlinense]
MKLRIRSIFFKLVCPVILVLGISAIVLVLGLVKIVSTKLIQNMQADVASNRFIVEDLINEELVYGDSVADFASSFFSGILTNNAANAVNEVSKMAFESLDLEFIAIFDTDGNLISPSEYAHGAVVNDDVQAALEGNPVSNLKMISGSLLTTDSCRPIYVNGEVVAAVEITTNLSDSDFLDRMPEKVGCDVAIIYKNKVVASTIKPLLGQSVPADVLADMEDDDTWVGEYDIDSTTYVAHCWEFSELDDCKILVAQKATGIYKSISGIKSIVLVANIINTIVVMIVTLILIWIFVYKPLKRTNKAIINLSSGEADLSVRLPERGGDEFEDLASGVNKFIALLQQLMKDLNLRAIDIKTVIQELGTSSQETASATAEIMANIESVKNQSSNQVNAVQNVSSVIENSSNSMNKLKENIVAQTSDITESSAAIEQMIGNIHSVTDSTEKMSSSFSDLERLIKEGAENVKACSDVIKQVEEKSLVLADANNTIKSISSQTNL